jgi:EAL domain-containing protein (putative c-di-GMP-specific phosphodiesterase class I)
MTTATTTSSPTSGARPTLRLCATDGALASGGGPAMRFAPSTSVAGVHTGPWAARLREAIEQRLFVLHYQPIVSLADERVSHYEALLRLADGPPGELTAPGSFLAAAEGCGLIREIDRLVLADAIALLSSELGDERTPVAVNLSALSVVAEGTLQHIATLLERHEVDPRRLILEVTETAAIADMERAKAFCGAVRELGCAVALDDFGSGFGSFRYLKRLPFDFLKIDGDFVRGLTSSRNDQLVVQALVRVAKGMGKRTIAEYVGDARTIELLRRYGVDFGQGFGIGRPRAPLELFAAAA